MDGNAKRPRWSRGPKKRATSDRSPRKIDLPDLPWGTAELRPALIALVANARGSWVTAVDFEPEMDDAPIVALVLQALQAALDASDQVALKALEEGARRALGQTSERGGRRSDRALALSAFAERMDGYLARSSTRSADGAARPERPAQVEMTNAFFDALNWAGPIVRELQRKQLLPRASEALFADVRRYYAPVTEAFTQAIDSEGDLDGQRVVTIGLRALGYDTHNLFSYARKRDSRGSPR